MKRELLLHFFICTYGIKGLVPGLGSKGVEMSEKVVVMRASLSDASGGGDGEVVLIGDAGYDRFFCLRL